MIKRGIPITDKERWPFVFVLLIPIINIIATITTNYFPPATLNPGSIRVLLILVFIIWMFVKKKLDNLPPIKLTLVFLFYLFLLVMLSSDILYSLYIFIKVAVASLLFIVGYTYINSIKRLYKFHLSLFAVLVIILISILISNIFSLGLSDYLKDSFYFGEAGVNLTKNIALIVLISLIFFELNNYLKYKFLYVSIIVLAIIVLIIGMKRASILGLAFSLGVYILLAPNKGKTLIYYIIAFLLLWITYPYYSDVLSERFKARQEKTVMTINKLEEEGRVDEIKIELNKFSQADLFQKLIGKDIFLQRKFYSRYRMLHIDFVNMLSGSGLIGLFLFLAIYLSIYYCYKKYYQYLKIYKLFKQMHALIISLFVLQFFMSIAGTIEGIELRGTILMYLGGLTGIAKNEANKPLK